MPALTCSNTVQAEECTQLARVASGESPYRITANVVACGDDVAVIIGGGEAPHIGAVALAIPRPSLADASNRSASVSVLCVTGHKEDELARATAGELAARFDCRVVVTVGIHIDDVERGDLTRLMSVYDDVVSGVSEAIARSHT